MSFVNLLDIVYPVGSIYHSWQSTSPAEQFGGSWTALTDDRVLLPSSTWNTTGGANNITLATTQIPAHLHGFGTNQRLVTWGALANGDIAFTAPGNVWGTRAEWSGGDSSATYNKISGNTSLSAQTTNAGGGQAHENRMPFRTCYAWYRTA